MLAHVTTLSYLTLILIQITNRFLLSYTRSWKSLCVNSATNKNALDFNHNTANTEKLSDLEAHWSLLILRPQATSTTRLYIDYQLDKPIIIYS